MGFFSGMTSGLYRRTIDGRRVIQLPSVGPRRRWPAYLVSDEDAVRVDARLGRATRISFFTIIPLAAFAPISQSLWYWAIVCIVPAVVQGALLRLWSLRGIPRVVVTASELEPITRQDREMNFLRATGAPTLLALVVVGIALTAFQVAVLILDRYWLAGIGSVVFAAMTIYMAYQLFVLRRAQGAESRI